MRRSSEANIASAEPGKIHYHITMMDLSRQVSRVVLEAPGGHAGSSSIAAAAPKVEDNAGAHSKITIVLKPPRPDNRKQTIYQSAAAPDLRIAMDLKLPNMVIGPSAVARPKIKFDPNSSRPTQAKRAIIAEAAPTLTTTGNPSMVLASELPKAQANLPVPPPASDTMVQNQMGLPTGGGAQLAGNEQNTLVIVGTDPSPATELLSLPAGNRWAELSISPGGGVGSSGDSPGKERGAGSGGAGSNGDASAGTGRGEPGRGAGGTGAGTLNIAGVAGGNSGSLDPMLPANMVYAVPASMVPRKNALVVSAGPMGGGGLDIYGALHCGKIYTVFLQMPGKSWTLQFCQAKREDRPKAMSGQGTIVRLDSGLVPPEPELRFDFRRLPLPVENLHKLVLLKGLIREDGTVDLVQVYRTLLPRMDEAARLAFSRWKFKPAMRDGQPVSVEILVGIPSETPAVRVTH
jgi:Gram-negative bacterial TonB protein C-terminal